MRSMIARLALACVCACGESATPSDAGPDGFTFGDSGFVDPYGDASLALRTRALFAQTCKGGPESGCHSDSAAGFTATLDPDGGDTVGVPATEMPWMKRVEPYQPEQSYLFWKVSGDPRIDGGTMPASSGYDPRIPSLIGPWIEAGAP